jgi:hypothetical protein
MPWKHRQIHLRITSLEKRNGIMELGTFTPRTFSDGDQLQAKEAVDRPLVVLVREHRTGIVTKFKPEGGEGVTVDIADVRTNEVWLNVLWMNGAVVDNLAGYIGQPVAVKLVWQASAKGGNAYITVAALEGQELALAQTWAQANTARFDTERATRAQQPSESTPGPTQLPSITTTATPAPPVSVAPSPDNSAPSAEAIAAAAQNPQVAALLAQIQAQQAQAS